ncbi:MAG TPA: NAD(+) diphosphatase [Steroidobacteraceae bacterium]|nr:NAD(+) diphosphatase [Steroidobacteraceae bacterium]
MDLDRPNFFAGPYIDRRAEERESADWLEAALADDHALFVVSRGTAQLVRKEAQPAIEFLPPSHPLLRGIDPRRLVLLGWFRGSRCLLAEIDPVTPFEVPAGTGFEELRALAPGLPADEAGLLAYARALSIWRARHRYCGLCGAPTVPDRAGHLIRCTKESCLHEFFPRLDPAIIVLVTDGERALLGRQPGWAPGRYSTIAGFVEPGESLEDAVAREVMEETGVHVTHARYDSSQPWPFPSSLMIGFQARAQPGARIVVGNELEDAQWFTRLQIRSDGIPLIPPSHSISYRLIATWLEGDG